MNIYIAVSDQDGYTSNIYGAFSTEEKARAACEEDAGRPLKWADGRASLYVTTYTVLLVSLDEAI